MQITINISDDGSGTTVSTDGQPLSQAQHSRPAAIPDSWWAEARQTYANHTEAYSRNDFRKAEITKQWLGGLLKAVVLIYGADHQELMQEIMVNTQQQGASWEGLGVIDREAPLPTELSDDVAPGASLLFTDRQPVRVDMSKATDLSALGELDYGDEEGDIVLDPDL